MTLQSSTGNIYLPSSCHLFSLSFLNKLLVVLSLAAVLELYTVLFKMFFSSALQLLVKSIYFIFLQIQRSNKTAAVIVEANNLCVCVCFTVYPNERLKDSHLCPLVVNQIFREDEFVAHAGSCVYLLLCTHLFLLSIF